MPKKFAFILFIIQALLSFLHYLLYLALLELFPTLALHHVALLITILALSVSFLAFSIVSHFWDNIIVAAGYYLAGVWLILCGYSMIALALALVIFGLSGWQPQTLGIIAIGLSSLLTIYGMINARIIRTVNLQVKLPNLPEAWANRTIVMVSDIHLGHILRIGFAKRVIKKINRLKAHVVLIPGDFYDGVHTDFPGLADAFKKLNAPLGSFFSSGNHEMFAGYGVCERAISHAGIKILENQKVEIDGLQFVGLSYHGDPVTYDGETDENVKSRLDQIGINKDQPSILLKHVPNHLAAVEAAGINLQLSGHSHQGQVWPGSHITKKIWKGFDYGFKTFGKLQVYTSSGVGTWGPPLRVFTKAEIVKINLQ